jgi:predicted SprT family Zn-dependent metalloprotease
MIPWLVWLGREEDESLIIQVVKHEIMSSHVFSKKQEGQFLKLIEALMQVLYWVALTIISI